MYIHMDWSDSLFSPTGMTRILGIAKKDMGLDDREHLNYTQLDLIFPLTFAM